MVTGKDLDGSWLVYDQVGGKMEDLKSGRIQPALERAERDCNCEGNV